MANKERPNQIVHRLINEERRRRGLPWARWSQEMYLLAKDQANKMASAGRLFHSDRFALQGGENCWMGEGYSEKALPKAIVDSWMKSKAGHRDWLLDPRVKSAGMAITLRGKQAYAAWAFSDQPPRQPAKIKPFKFKMPFKLRLPLFKPSKAKGGEGMLRLPVYLILKCLSVLGIALGAHGFYVYLHRLDFPSVGAEKLFLVVSVPVRLESLVLWMTAEGVKGWFIPVVFIIGGIVLWSYSDRINVDFTLMRKLRLLLQKLHLW